MADLAYWDDSDGLWDRLKLGPHHMPGAWEVDCDCERQIDKKKTKGKDGARLKDHGYLPGSVTLRGRFLTKEEWSLMQAILPDIHPRKKGGKRNPLAVEHPALAVMGVATVYVRKIRAPRIVDNGLLELEIECLEWVKPTEAKTSTAPSKYVPKEWSDKQLAANAGVDAINTLPGRNPNQNIGYAFTPAEIAKANADQIDDQRRAKEIASLLKKK